MLLLSVFKGLNFVRMGLVDCILYSVFACVDGCVRDQVCLCVLFKSKGPCHSLINGEQCVFLFLAFLLTE